MARRSNGEGTRTKEGAYFRYELRVGGQRYVRKARTKADLEAKVIELRRQLARLDSLDTSDVSFGDAFDRFLVEKTQSHCSPNTLASYNSLRRCHLSPIESVTLASLSAKEIGAIVTQKIAEEKHRTARYALEMIHRVLEYAIRQGWLTRNVANSVDKPRDKPASTRAMQLHELQLVLSTAEQRWREHRFRYYPLVLFLLNTAARVSEALALRELDIKLTESTEHASIRWQLFRRGRDWTLLPAKQHSHRDLPLNAEALRAVELGRIQRGRDRVAAKEAYCEHLLLFSDEMGAPVLRTTPYHAMVRLQRELGVTEPYTLHELRHTYLSYVARSAPLHVVSRIAGHKNLRTTERYLHALQDDINRAVKSVVLGGEKR